MIGWRARIGVIVPATNTATEHEFWPALPAGATLSFTRIISSRDTDQVKRLSSYRDGAIEGAREVAEVRPDLIVWACTSGSFVNGAGYDRELAGQMTAATRIPVLTTSTALVTALETMGVRRIALGAPYPQQITDVAARFLQDSVPGLSVVNTAIIDIADPYSRGKIAPEEAYRLAKRADTDEAEAIVLSCTDLQTFAVVEALEHDLGKPVVSANLATLWALLGRLGLPHGPAPGRIWAHPFPG